MNRQSSHKALYNSVRWQRLRQKSLLRDLMTCQICGVLCSDGKDSSRSAVVDHIVPHRGDHVRFHDSENLWTVCKRCHDSVCQRIEATHSDPEQIRREKMSLRGSMRGGTVTAYDVGGRPLDPTHPWNL